MVWEIIILVVLGGAFVVLKVLHSENERKRRMDRAERDLRVKAATGGFAPKQWDESRSGEDEPEEDETKQESSEGDEKPDPEEPEEKAKTD